MGFRGVTPQNQGICTEEFDFDTPTFAELNQFNRQTSPSSLLLLGASQKSSPALRPRGPVPLLRARPDQALLFLLFASKMQTRRERERDAGLLLVLRCTSRWGRRVSAASGASPAASKRGRRSCWEAPGSLHRGSGAGSWGLRRVWAPWDRAGIIHDKLCQKRRRALAVPEPRHL